MQSRPTIGIRPFEPRDAQAAAMLFADFMREIFDRPSALTSEASREP